MGRCILLYQLKNWVLYLWNERHGVAFGRVYNNPRFPQGHEIQTSAIEKIVLEEEQGQLCIVTRSGSHYCLKFSEMNFDAVEKIKACLAVYNISSEIFDKCVECAKRYKKGIEE